MHHGKKTILFLAANPVREAALRLDREIREIDAGLRAGPHRDFYVLEQRHAVQILDMRRAMLALRPQIVHFCGHGEGEEGLVLEGPTGEPKAVSTEALASFFKLFANSVECVLLNACMTDIQARAIVEHIPHVIGTPHPIPDGAGISFATGFYDALAAGKPVAYAYEIACSAAEMEHGLSGRRMPILFRGSRVAEAKTSFAALGSMSRDELMRVLSFFKTAAAADAADEDAHHSLGIAYLHLGLYDPASRAFRRAAELAPDYSDAYYYQAVAMVRGRSVKCLSPGEVRRMEELAKAAVGIEPTASKYWYLLGIIRTEFYQANGLLPPSPCLPEIRRVVDTLEKDSWELARLLHFVPASSERFVAWSGVKGQRL